MWVGAGKPSVEESSKVGWGGGEEQLAGSTGSLSGPFPVRTSAPSQVTESFPVKRQLL